MKRVYSDHASRTNGPFIHAVVHGNLVFTTACIPLDPDTMTIVGGGPENQLRRIFDNIKVIPEESGTTLGRIIKQNVYLTDIEQVEAFNKVSVEYLGDHMPSRATLKVLGLPRNAPMGLDVVAALPEEE
ncbi:hypothetical protein N8T08_005584 [Aspergillus melleus]|uniref:Uncharacterized protein n=1 Tax=Aspergillus melleus TaxID=138277 RepID=A0ACC3B2E2_9EURO|nr:hypothetical protein N8T08_005584 [Aspergillus melleus]